jgi:hypothetical protein
MYMYMVMHCVLYLLYLKIPAYNVFLFFRILILGIDRLK